MKPTITPPADILPTEAAEALRQLKVLEGHRRMVRAAFRICNSTRRQIEESSRDTEKALAELLASHPWLHPQDNSR